MLARIDVRNNFKSLFEIYTDAALSGDTSMLIDEWQTVLKLWNAVRYTVDHRRNVGLSEKVALEQAFDYYDAVNQRGYN